MIKRKSYIAFLVAGAIGLGVTLFCGQGDIGSMNPLKVKAECDHVGYHYEEVAPTAIKQGHSEFYVCCKCHEHFSSSSKPAGSFTDKVSTDETRYSILEGDDRYIAPVGFSDKFPDSTTYLCKVGNMNSINYGQLFDYGDEISDFAIESVTASTLSKHRPLIGKNVIAFKKASGTTDKSNKTILFSGNGVIKVSPIDVNGVTHEDSGVYVEVVNAKNITSLGQVDGTEISDCTSDYALLSNSPMWNSLTFINAGHTLYGNGFTFSDSSRGTYLKSGGMARGFISVTNGAVLENLVIKNRVFPKAFIYNSEGSEYVTQSSNLDTEATEGDRLRYMYQLSSVLLGSNGTINNCYIYGGRNNVLITGGDVKISNSILDSGTLANIQVNSASGSTITLDKVTTIQRLNSVTIDAAIKREGDTDPAKVYGSCIMIGKGESGETNPTIQILNGLKQYNWVSSSEANQVTSSTIAKTLFNNAIEIEGIQKTYDSRTYANTGIAVLNSASLTIVDDKSSQYLNSSISIGGKTGQIYSIKSEYGTVEFINSQAEAIALYQASNKDKENIKPAVEYIGDVEGASITSTFDAGNAQWKYKLEINKSDSFGEYTFNKSDLKVSVRGKSYDFLFKNSDGDSITSVVLSQTGTTSYSLVFDATGYPGAGGSSISSTISYDLPLDIIFTIGSKPTLTKTSDPSGTAVWVGTGTDAWNIATDALDGLKIEYYQSTGEYYTGNLKDKVTFGSGKLNGTNNSFTFNGTDFDLTITSTGFKTNDAGMPVGAGGILYFTIQTTSGFCSASTTSRSATLTYTFTDKFNNTLTFSKSFSKSTPSQATDIYKYSSFCNGTLEKCSSGGGCISGDTLISLMDGTKVRADSLKAGDIVASFNHETGKIEPQVILHNEDAGMEKELAYVVNLGFSNGSNIKVIDEHGFFDFDLMQYVYIDMTNYTDFIGHEFASVNNGNIEHVTLTEAECVAEMVSWCSPTTAYNLNIITEDILSMPGGIEGMFNTFEFDNDLKYNETKMAEDIEKYGLYTFEEFSSEFEINEYSFDVYNGKYLKVAIGKGLITKERIAYLLERYGQYTASM